MRPLCSGYPNPTRRKTEDCANNGCPISTRSCLARMRAPQSLARAIESKSPLFASCVAATPGESPPDADRCCRAVAGLATRELVLRATTQSLSNLVRRQLHFLVLGFAEVTLHVIPVDPVDYHFYRSWAIAQVDPDRLIKLYAFLVQLEPIHYQAQINGSVLQVHATKGRANGSYTLEMCGQR